MVLADSGSQARLGRRPGRLVGDFGGLDGPNLGPKMASSWGLDRTKIDANIARIFDAFENRNLDEQIDFLIGRCCFLDLIWDEILIICKFRNERGKSHKTTIFIVPEGLSRPSEDCNIE